MKILIFGLGSIGRRHAGILKKHFQHDLFAFRSGQGAGANDLGIPEIRTWREVEQIHPNVAVITNPTYRHVDVAIQCAKRGMHLFIEKPLGSRLGRLPQLKRLIARKKLSAYVAYVLRFHPLIHRLKEYLSRGDFLHMRIVASSYLPLWRPGSCHLEGYSAHLKRGGGIIYDLSHELDYAGYLLGGIRKLSGQFGRRSDVTVDAEDYADILLETGKGPANIHLNFMGHNLQRTIQIDFKDKCVEGDLMKKTIREFRKGKLVKEVGYSIDINDCFRKQFEYFFAHIGEQRMMNNILEASDLIQKINAFKKQRMVS